VQLASVPIPLAKNLTDGKNIKSTSFSKGFKEEKRH
jgi:hypothetical protein